MFEFLNANMSKHNLCSDVFWVPGAELLSNNRLSNCGLPEREHVENKLSYNVCWVPGGGAVETQFVF